MFDLANAVESALGTPGARIRLRYAVESWTCVEFGATLPWCCSGAVQGSDSLESCTLT